MSYTYLLELYKEIEFRLEKARNSVRHVDYTVSTHFEEGRIHTLNEFHSFLEKRYHLKLPKRLQKKHLKRGIDSE